VTRRLEANVETDPKWHRSSSCKVVFHPRKEVTERPLAAAEQGMHMLRLRYSGSVRRLGWEGVALEHGHMLEVICEDARGGQAGHPSTDHNRLPGQKFRCHRHLPSSWYCGPIAGAIVGRPSLQRQQG